jgi:8-oxo-dGTP diphosphatase
MEVTHTLGFVFDYTHSHLMLIRKNRPEWQKGFFNGVGGGVEKGETSLECIIRETEEESGLRINDWRSCGHLISPEWNVEVFVSTVPMVVLEMGESKTDEQIHIFDMIELYDKNILPSAQYLIHLTRNYLMNQGIARFKIEYV